MTMCIFSPSFRAASHRGRNEREAGGKQYRRRLPFFSLKSGRGTSPVEVAAEECVQLLVERAVVPAHPLLELRGDAVPCDVGRVARVGLAVAHLQLVRVGPVGPPM